LSSLFAKKTAWSIFFIFELLKDFFVEKNLGFQDVFVAILKLVFSLMQCKKENLLNIRRYPVTNLNRPLPKVPEGYC